MGCCCVDGHFDTRTGSCGTYPTVSDADDDVLGVNLAGVVVSIVGGYVGGRVVVAVNGEEGRYTQSYGTRQGGHQGGVGAPLLVGDHHPPCRGFILACSG